MNNSSGGHDSRDPEDFNFDRINQRRIIIGFDPGLTVGMAIMGLNGNIISLASFKEVSRAEVINHIISHGRVVVVATDVYPPPKMVKKLASILNSKIYSPHKVLTVDTKNELVDGYIHEIASNLKPENAHQRDALAAAIKTYKHYEKKFNQIEKRIADETLDANQKDEIKYMVIKGTPITKAINEVRGVEKVPDNQSSKTDKIASSSISSHSSNSLNSSLNDTQESHDKSAFDSGILTLKKRLKSQEKQVKNQEAIIKNLRDKNKILKNRIQKQKKKTSKLQSKLDKLHYAYSQDILHRNEISAKIKIIKNLQEKYNQEKAIRKKLEHNLNSIKEIESLEFSDNSIPVKIVRSFTREGIKEACKYWKIKKGDVILLSSSEGGGSSTANLIVQMGVKAVVVPDEMSHPAIHVLKEADIPIIPADRLKLKQVDEFAIVESENLNREIEKWENIINEQRKKEEKQKLWNVIDEYRAKRKREPRE